MTMMDGLSNVLVTDDNLNGVLSGRSYIGQLPRGYVFPAVVLHRYGGSQDYDMSGPVGVREDQIQIDVYANSAAECQQIAEYVRAALVGYAGTLSDGTVVQACYLERFMDMPFLPNADAKGISSRSMLAFRVITTA